MPDAPPAVAAAMPPAHSDASTPARDWTAVVDAIHAAQQSVLHALAASEVPAQWFAVLRQLDEAPERRMTMSELARNVAMTSGGFTKLADRMARDGLIDRRGASADRRVVHAVLTDRGRILARECAETYDAAVRELVLGAISGDELEVLARLAARLGAVRPANPVSAGDATHDEFLIREPKTPQGRRAHDKRAEESGR